MSTKRSAFSVFRTREKSESVSHSDENDLTLVSVKKTDSQLEIKKVVSLSAQNLRLSYISAISLIPRNGGQSDFYIKYLWCSKISENAQKVYNIMFKIVADCALVQTRMHALRVPFLQELHCM